MDIREKKKINDKIRNSAATRLTLDKVNDGTKMQELQVSGLKREKWASVERFQNYGFTSNPPAGECVGVPIGGDRSQIAILAVDDRGSRKSDLAGGEVAIYHANGDSIHLKEGNKLELTTKEGLFKLEISFDVECPKVTIKGDVEIQGSLTVTGDVKAGTVSLQNHKHIGDSGGVTEKPIA